MARRKSTAGTKSREKAQSKRKTTGKAKPASTDGASPAAASGKADPSAEGASPDLQPQILLTHDQIAARAYALWEARGGPAGQEEVIWKQAEHELWQEARR